jgi:hypothetical protein
MDRATLKAFFETGDMPTQAQFEDLIDAFQLTEALEANADEMAAVLALAGITPRSTLLASLLPHTDADKLAFLQAAFAPLTGTVAPATPAQIRASTSGGLFMTPEFYNEAKATVDITADIVANVVPVDGQDWWRAEATITVDSSIGAPTNVANHILDLILTANGAGIDVTAHADYTLCNWGDGITSLAVANGKSARFRIERLGDKVLCTYMGLLGTLAAIDFAATGGNTITDSGGFRYHTFTSSGVFTVTASSRSDVEALIVGGGGSGGSFRAGGGGGGAVRAISTVSVDAGTSTYTVTVGAGGAAVAVNGAGNNGGNSSVFGTTSLGGGGGGATSGGAGTAGIAGGSGGGAGGSASAAGSGGTAGTGGNAGGNGFADASTSLRSGGGGGGAGAVGANGASGVAGAGGAGSALSWPTSVTYGAGGGGGVSSGTAGAGGTGGGGAGGSAANGSNATGVGAGGGAGGSSGSTSGAGATGKVIIRYPL